MEPEFTAGKAAADAELFIHLDMDGLAALLRAVEAAMATGRGHLTPRSGSAVIVGSGGSGAFGRVTVTFAHSAGPSHDRGPISKPTPDPVPRSRVPAMS
ncbi:MAG TPA: hypothetical protein VD846_07600 [Allosphingosinicella sp.]|nr:hypothetical protein [Allosphingosinicella sp.]